MTDRHKMLYILRQEDTDLWIVDAIDISLRHTFAGPCAAERAAEFVATKNATAALHRLTDERDAEKETT